MKRFLTFFVFAIFSFVLSSCIAPVKVSAQNYLDKWFCQSLRMNAVLTGSGGVTARSTTALNVNGLGIIGTDTTIFIAVPDQHKNSWWSAYCSVTALGTGGTGNHAYFCLRGSMDGVTSFILPGDTVSKASNGGGKYYCPLKASTANTDFFKFTLSVKTAYNFTFGPFQGFPYPYAAIYISKGVDSTTISSKIFFTPPLK